MNTKDPYQTLGITPSATLEEARAAWLRRVRVLHPDRFDPVKQKVEWDLATQMLQEVNAAWETIKTRQSESASGETVRPPDERQGTASAPRNPRPPFPEERVGPASFSILAIISFALCILGLAMPMKSGVLSGSLPLLFLVAVIFAHVAKSGIRKSGYRGKWMATLSLWVGYFVLIISASILAFAWWNYSHDEKITSYGSIYSDKAGTPASSVGQPTQQADKNSFSASGKELAWNLPIRLGDTIERVRSVFGQPNRITNATTESQFAEKQAESSSDAVVEAKKESEEWINETPNLQIEAYYQYALRLHYNSSQLTMISLNNPEVEAVGNIYNGPTIDGLSMTDDLQTLFGKLGTPNNPGMTGVPADVAYDKHYTWSGCPNVYSWDFGDVFVLVTVRNKDEQINNENFPKDTISQIMIIRHLPPGKSPRLEPHPVFDSSVSVMD